MVRECVLTHSRGILKLIFYPCLQRISFLSNIPEEKVKSYREATFVCVYIIKE